jgi:hypothetical protein
VVVNDQNIVSIAGVENMVTLCSIFMVVFKIM